MSLPEALNKFTSCLRCLDPCVDRAVVQAPALQRERVERPLQHLELGGTLILSRRASLEGILPEPEGRIGWSSHHMVVRGTLYIL